MISKSSDNTMQVLNIIAAIIFYYSSFVVVYYFLLALIGLFFHKQKYPLVADKLKFCIFVPCHNEGSVISATVANLALIDYDQSLFDIYFIADNCTDNTAESIRQAIAVTNRANLHLLERNVPDPLLRGKPHALRWGIDLLEGQGGFYSRYDMFMIFDADNFADPLILRHVNSQYLSIKDKKKPVAIQCYLDSKNKNNLISRGYFASYRVSNGFWQLPKNKLGLNASIGGTGFAVTTKFLKSNGGYNCSSLTEDLELQTIATLRNQRVGYNKNVRIYDEKPTGLWQSMVQKTRWAQGHWYICFKYSWRLFFSLFDLRHIGSFFRKLDNIIYLFSMCDIVCGALFVVIRFIMWLTKTPLLYIPPVASWILFGIGMFMLLMIAIAAIYDGKKKEKKTAILEFIPNLIGVVLSSFIFIYAATVGLFKCPNQKVWKKTAHKVTKMEARN
jgi:cellulose synthase/poly-beta-1,6-N-acetylglucosamine synthase-like glycosyltransferase